MPTISVDDLDIAYRVQGSGPALLLVAGTGYPGGTWWPPLVEALARNHTVIWYDHRGTGQTRGDAAGLSTRRLAGDAVGLLEALGCDRVSVLGHSMGGRVAQWIALDRPDLVERLVLAATGPGPLPGSQGHTRGVPVHAAAGMVELGYRNYVTRVQRETFFTDAFATEQSTVVQWLVEAFWQGRPSVRDYFEHVAARQQHDTVDQIHRIEQPALVIVGEMDTHRRGTGSHLEQSHFLAGALPAADLVVLPALKHGFLWEAPETSANCITTWLTGP